MYNVVGKRFNRAPSSPTAAALAPRAYNHLQLLDCSLFSALRPDNSSPFHREQRGLAAAAAAAAERAAAYKSAGAERSLTTDGGGGGRGKWRFACNVLFVPSGIYYCDVDLTL